MKIHALIDLTIIYPHLVIQVSGEDKRVCCPFRWVGQAVNKLYTVQEIEAMRVGQKGFTKEATKAAYTRREKGQHWENLGEECPRSREQQMQRPLRWTSLVFSRN